MYLNKLQKNVKPKAMFKIILNAFKSIIIHNLTIILLFSHIDWYNSHFLSIILVQRIDLRPRFQSTSTNVLTLASSSPSDIIILSVKGDGLRDFQGLTSCDSMTISYKSYIYIYIFQDFYHDFHVRFRISQFQEPFKFKQFASFFQEHTGHTMFWGESVTLILSSLTKRA